MIGPACSHGIAWHARCVDCEIVSLTETVEKFGPMVERARAKLAELRAEKELITGVSMATKKQKMRAPANCRTADQVCELVRASISTPKSWILLDGADGVIIYNQRPGKSSTGSVTLSRAEFLKFAQWYTKPQRIVKRSSN